MLAWIAAAAAGLTLTGWAWWGDRAKGRRRCRACWYDMKDSASLTCPECGRVHRDERELGRTRRRRRLAGLGVLIALVSGGAMVAGGFEPGFWHGWAPSSLLVFRAGDGSWADEELRDRLTENLGGAAAPNPDALWEWQRRAARRAWTARGPGDPLWSIYTATRSLDLAAKLDPGDWWLRQRPPAGVDEIDPAVGRACPSPDAWRDASGRGAKALRELLPLPGWSGVDHGLEGAAVRIAPLREGEPLESGCVVLVADNADAIVLAEVKRGEGWVLTAARSVPIGWHDGATTLEAFAGRAFVRLQVCTNWGTGIHGEDMVLLSPHRPDVPVVLRAPSSESFDMFSTVPSEDLEASFATAPEAPGVLRGRWRLEVLGAMPDEGDRAPIRFDAASSESPAVAPLEWRADYRWSDERHGFELAGWDWTGEDPPRIKPAFPPTGLSYEREGEIRAFNRRWRHGTR